MKQLKQQTWLLGFLAILLFQIVGTTLHFADQSGCSTFTESHKHDSVSSADHCKICAQLHLLQQAYLVPNGVSFTSFSADFLTEEPSQLPSLVCVKQTLEPQRGPPSLA